jgi:mono/diheme cytochrome c family protein
MVRTLVACGAMLVAFVLSFMPVISNERNVPVHDHHLDHAVLMFFGVVAGLALYRQRGSAESPAWIWGAILAPLVATFLMAPSLYAAVDAWPWLHAFDHLAFVVLAMLAAYAGQRYVAGVGWAVAIMLQTMAVVAAFGYGVAPQRTAAAAESAAIGAAPAGDAARGKQLFAQNCAMCHGPEGAGAEAPRLKGEATRKNTAQLVAWIKKPAPPMPTLYPSPLNQRDVDDIAAYVEQLK